jgi:UDP-N-acetylglucosamine--N-acetylmuramyl-(pentapeptide) pyrophosphoryl-undecaprenol N-acetylglucosamine transferase
MALSNPTEPNQPKRFLIACGGTGGHLFPGISVAQELKRRGHEVLLLVSEKKIDQRALQGHPDLQSKQIAMIGKPRTLSFAMVKFLFKFWKQLGNCKKILNDSRADAVLGMGGFTSLPPVMAARRLGKPTFIHESNAIPGKANKLTAKYCSAVFVGMDVCTKHFPGKTCHTVGTPVRDGLREPVDKTAALASFGLDPSKLTMLVMGGSQGARGVNDAVLGALPQLDPAAIQFIHLTGADGEAEVREVYEKSGFTHHVAAFCDRMAEALTCADMSLCRSGASSMSELAHFGIPSILVPYPHAAEDHQTHNARPFADGGAAVLCPQGELTGESLAKVIQEKFLIASERDAMHKNMHSFSSDDANIMICDIMEAQTA